ncbi:MAG: bifunctional serine/threonine-protein kinase/ABC transporter substrate-binding protein, partial [Chloroflexi bacterium]|nr:bifunctional serine/threonine-protein kinase/ABC transporter substrate-binding protein [Chloroflexota bacterium]MCI0577209.1 bifunctional serine/threonine-protein kinase/ABC transporter substrate-binding protein [Chloroflexota bacterium]MCI0649081.1 bifunctional serine/threonine-protein kinase/ABC transporter substrate-binding protein [Chloroflexota bacterium]MCI0729702.1 bifunctional serine/threonine-protein kinase/ABC transporter substrate-binding protein [Chloroflexota bacterium]
MAQQIDRYEIRAEIGRGGMATVFHAYDPRFKRDVAIKVLPRELVHSPTFKARFEREAQTIAALEHPAIVPVYDFGEEDGQPYLVMRFMTGGSLADRLKPEPLSLGEAGRIFRRLAPALDSAHARGIIHRDLKPGNILFDQWNEPHLSDFGIVKLAAAGGAELTGTGGILGTPAYMSPEQVLGTQELDGRSDVYALGVIFFEMLTGRRPYQADTPMGLAFKHVNEPIPQVLELNAALPPGCQVVIDRAMAKDREDRYATAEALAAAITGVAGEAATPPELTRLVVRPTTEALPDSQAATRLEPPTPAPAEALPDSQVATRLEEPPPAGLPPTTVEPRPEPTAATRVAPAAAPAQKRGRGPAWAWAAGGLGLLCLALVAALALGGRGLLAALAGQESPTPRPAATTRPAETGVVAGLEELQCQDPLGCVKIEPGDPIKVASLQAISGAVASLGTDQVRGIEIAIADKGLIKGHAITLQSEDDLCSSEGGTVGAQRIVADPRIIGIIGTTCSGAGVPAAEIMSEAGLVMISSSNTSPVMTTEDGQTPGRGHQVGYFRTAHNDTVQGAAAAQFAYTELGLRQAASIH